MTAAELSDGLTHAFTDTLTVLLEPLLEEALDLVDAVVDTEVDGDAFFPSLDDTVWREVAREQHDADQRHAFAFAFVTLERQKP